MGSPCVDANAQIPRGSRLGQAVGSVDETRRARPLACMRASILSLLATLSVFACAAEERAPMSGTAGAPGGGAGTQGGAGSGVAGTGVAGTGVAGTSVAGMDA